jgi:hypothetical protein
MLERSWKKEAAFGALGVIAVFSGWGCATFPSSGGSASRSLSSPRSDSELGEALLGMGARFYSANLHAHHFMGAKGTKKNPLRLEEALTPGECKIKNVIFEEDDGVPCRDDGGKSNQMILPRTRSADGSYDLTDYFRQACEYGTKEGLLDVLFVTPHTKNGQVGETQIATSSRPAELERRRRMLKGMNPSQEEGAGHYCGLGQEASSISAGNHINILGQFRIDEGDASPLLFPSGDFAKLYADIGRRIGKGERILLQLNHPNASQDLWLGDMTQLKANKKLMKEKLNDYGLDDFAPVSCLLGKGSDSECGIEERNSVDITDVKKTYARIREESKDPFRLIEVIPPSMSGKDGEGFGATSNTTTVFRKVQKRVDANTHERGVRDWIFYLAMGFKLAPTANQDNHHMNFGSSTASRTGVLASDLREASVLDALDRRRTFASEDVNAKVLVQALDDSGAPIATMGDSIATHGNGVRIRVAYEDPDEEDREAEVRLYYYREDDDLDFSHRAPFEGVFRTVAAGKIPVRDAKGRPEGDLIPIAHGRSAVFDITLENGMQWIFAEVIQRGDRDKIWSAPIWFEKTPGANP